MRSIAFSSLGNILGPCIAAGLAAIKLYKVNSANVSFILILNIELFLGVLSSCLILFCFRDQNKVILRTSISEYTATIIEANYGKKIKCASFKKMMK